jgi:hypothetical protein
MMRILALVLLYARRGRNLQELDTRLEPIPVYWILQSSTDPDDDIELLGILVVSSLAEVPHVANKQNILSDLCQSLG